MTLCFVRSLGLSALIAIPFSAATHADTIFGIYAGAGNISYDLAGDFQDQDDNGSVIDMEDDLNLKGDSGSYFYIAVEHFIPLIPNIKLAQSEIEETSRSSLNQDIRFQGQTFPKNTIVATKIDFSHTDLTLYYELLDNWVNLDLGLTARKMDGEVSIAGQGPISAEEKLNQTIPMLYGKAQFDLPLTGLYIGAEANLINIAGVEVTDLWGRVGYVFGFGLGLELGMREVSLELDDVEDLDASIDLSGTYLAASFHF